MTILQKKHVKICDNETLLKNIYFEVHEDDLCQKKI